jgi:plastocyanin
MRREQPVRVLLAAAAAAVSVLLATAVSAADGTVRVEDTAFSPTSVTIAAGDSVTWDNVTSTTGHTATADNGSFDTGPIRAGQSVTITFLMPGTFPYSCSVLPSMKGTVIVTDAPKPTPTASHHRPPSTDLAPVQGGGSGGPPVALLLGLLLCGGALVAAGFQRSAVRREQATAWSVLEPGEAPSRGVSIGERYDPGKWTDDDRFGA